MSTSTIQPEQSALALPAPAAVEEAVEQTLGALLQDRDVTELDGLEGGLLHVIRRGRRQRGDSFLEGPLFAVLRDQLDASPSVPGAARLRLKTGHEVRFGVLLDGRLALSLLKAPTLDVTLDELEEEGLLPAGIGVEMLSNVVEGLGLLALGPARGGRQRLIVALARAAQAQSLVYGLSDALAGLLPVPRGEGRSIVDRARDAAALGADTLCALELSAAELHDLVVAGVGLPILASVRAPSMDALSAGLLGVSVVAASAQSAVCGHAPNGIPRLVELHTPPHEDRADDAAGHGTLGRGSSLDETDLQFGVPRTAAALRERPRAAATVVVEEANTSVLPQIADVPAGWASDAPDDDPGWELAGPPSAEPKPVPGSFDAALAAQRRLPSFTPRPPLPHPQTGGLQARGLPRGDPFGGLTLEPPPGAPPENEE